MLTGTIGWRWIFWVLSIFDAALMLMALIFFPETYAGILLHRKAKRMREQTSCEEYYAQHERVGTSLPRVLATSVARPFRMLISQPFIQVMSIFLAYNYGVLYVIQSMFATM